MVSLLLPILLMAAAWFLAPLSASVPASFSGLWEFGPFLSMGVVALLALAWGRGRALLAALVFAAAVAAVTRPAWLPEADTGLLADLSLFVFLPLNLAIICWYQERGIFNVFGAMRVGFVAAQFGAMLLVCVRWPGAANAFVTGVLPPAPQVDVPSFLLATSAAGIAVSAGFGLWQRGRFAAAVAVALAGPIVAVLFPGREGAFDASVIAAGLVIVISMLQDSWRLAYRDELTGLPSRRALFETFLSLGGRYSVAMLDVDHFKKFNDTHGHDVGDDVLRMVASRIARVSGGGRAFRYGGEEFTIVFPSRPRAEAAIALEGVRAAIEGYEMVVRDRREEDHSGERGKGKGASQQTVSVTISIGLAERERGESPEQVIKRADEALYEAKKAGRNRVLAWGEKARAKRAKKAA